MMEMALDEGKYDNQVQDLGDPPQVHTPWEKVTQVLGKGFEKYGDGYMKYGL